MIPLQVTSTAGAIDMGRQNYDSLMSGNLQGMRMAGKGFENAMINTRLALAESDKNAYNLAFPMSVGDDYMRNNYGGLLRAAEAAGISTGHIPMSRQDEMDRQEAMQSRREEYSENQRKMNEILGMYKNAVSNARMYEGQAVQYEGMGNVDGANKQKEYARAFLDQAEKLKASGMSMGLPVEYFVDANEMKTGDGVKGFATDGELNDFALEVANASTGMASDASVAAHEKATGKTLSNAERKKVLEKAQGIYNAKVKTETDESESRSRAFQEEEAKKRAAEDAKVRAEEQKKRDLAAKQRDFEAKKLEYETATAAFNASSHEAKVKSQGDFIRSDPAYSESNVIKMATLFPEFKAQMEEVGGKSLSQMIASGLANWINNKDSRIKTQYNAFLQAQKNNKAFRRSSYFESLGY